MKLPILLDHDHTKPIGAVELVDGALQMRFDADVKITKDIAFQIFGDLGFQVLEYSQQDGLMLIRKARILEWSLCPAPAAQPLALWQPIDTAPKDGSWVLLRGGHTTEDDYSREGVRVDRPVTAFWDEARKSWAFCYWDGAWRENYENPTHWRSLDDSTHAVDLAPNESA
jgi:hypothetical protein